MEILSFILNIFGVVAVSLTIAATIFTVIFFGMPRFSDWVDLNIAKDYLENRAEKKVRDLKRQIRIVELQEEAVKLEKKIEEKNVRDESIRKMNERAI